MLAKAKSRRITRSPWGRGREQGGKASGGGKSPSVRWGEGDTEQPEAGGGTSCGALSQGTQNVARGPWQVSEAFPGARSDLCPLRPRCR